MSKIITTNGLSTALSEFAEVADDRYLKLEDISDVDDRITVANNRVYLDKNTANEIELEIAETVVLPTLISQALSELNTDN